MVDRLLQNALGKTLRVIDMGGNGTAVAASGMGLGQRPAAEIAVILEAIAIQLGHIHRSLPIAEMANIDVITCRVGAPTQKGITGGLQQPLPFHHPLTLMLRCRQIHVGSQHGGFGLLALQH